LSITQKLGQKTIYGWALASVLSQMVDFGSGQGLSDFETGGIACYFEDFKRVKTLPRAKRCRLWMGTKLHSYANQADNSPRNM